MSVAELSSQLNTGSETREILGPAGNRVRNTEEQIKKPKNQKQNKEVVNKEKKKTEPNQKLVSTAKTGNIVLKSNSFAADSSSDSLNSVASCNSSNGVVKDNILGSVERKLKNIRVNRPTKIVADGVLATGLSSGPIKRCDWITQNSEPLYIQFHDKEWGVPVRDDKKLFELLILSQALGELSWPTILYKRETFRIMFEDFDPSSIAKYDEKKLLSVQNRNILSEPKLRAVMDNARQFLKIQEEFGSFSTYCWRFVNNRQIKSGYRYGRQVSAKTSKSEVISKDLTRRGFRYVGPTIVYSFMQVAGLVNDHLSTCFRFSECDGCTNNMDPTKLINTDAQGEATTKTCTLNGS